MGETETRTASELHAGAEPAPAGTLIHNLDIRFSALGPERVVATMPVDGRTLMPYGRLHGGASVALAETVASAGSAQNIDRARQLTFGLEINANHIRGVAGGCVVAEAVPLHRGRTTHVWSITIRDDDGRLVCTSRCTMAVVDRG